eukprot:CAMPEP_0197413984 /NCGR_PEP_ID=MMETSP1170-20131217/785_1 /TAXON_ID=54406 /ORGANISM="Sarcinochrysis sp, Strain CCMP770" /LENGTH=48 /DNA_ID= /DNA_START= /DNA_END= /DNA_ORIENTATION=
MANSGKYYAILRVKDMDKANKLVEMKKVKKLKQANAHAVFSRSWGPKF